ncbi:MAG: hypothetical protein V3S01_08950, partial [Dehalococcoidia bacterium]
MFEDAGNRVVMHQPQLDEWDDYSKLRGRAAVAVTLKGDEKEYYGALDIEADTETDFDSRTVLMKNFRITRVFFPNIDERLAARCGSAVGTALPARSVFMSLDRVLAAIERVERKSKGIEVSLEPPPVYYSEVPAVLVIFMGEPRFEKIDGVTGLMYA